MEPSSAASAASQVRGHGGGHAALRKAEGPVTRSAADGILEKVCASTRVTAYYDQITFTLLYLVFSQSKHD